MRGEKTPVRLFFEKNREKLWLCGLFFVYALLLLWIVIFKARFELPRVRDERVLNLIPFYNGGEAHNRITVAESVANLFVFIPFGIYLGMLGVNKKLIPLFGFLCSLTFELVQYAFAIGVSDITDLFTNTVGTLTGLISYIVMCRVCKNKGRLDKTIMIVATALTAVSTAGFFILMVI